MTTATLPSAVPTATPAAPHRRPVRIALRIALWIALAAALVLFAVAAGSGVGTAISALRSASPAWIVAGLLATVASMVAFGVTRAATLAAAGHRVQLRRAVAVSYGAGALHTTLPGGTVFAGGYAFKHLRRWGVPSALAAWSMTISGVLSTVSLACLGLVGLLLTGSGSGLSTGTIVGIAVTIAATVLVRRMLRKPDAVLDILQRLLIRINRLRRVPAETGAATLRSTIDDMRNVRPSRRSWILPVVSSAGNWLLDLTCLACALTSLGVHVSLPALIVTYVAGMTAASALPLPGGLGGVETTMVLGLTVAGAAAAPAVAAVLLYRLMSTGSVVVIGWLTVAVQGRSATTRRVGRARSPEFQH